MIIDYVGLPGFHKTLNISSRIKRVSKTAQRVNATFIFKKPWPDSFSNVLTVYTFDHGMMKGLFTRTFYNTCQILADKTHGMLYKPVHQYVPYFPSSCPIPAGTWYVNNVEVPRYRKDWDADLQALIPLLVPESDKWRLEFENFDGNGTRLGIFRIELRLLNEFMSQ